MAEVVKVRYPKTLVHVAFDLADQSPRSSRNTIRQQPFGTKKNSFHSSPTRPRSLRLFRPLRGTMQGDPRRLDLKPKSCSCPSSSARSLSRPIS
jgi:hypothetical protein